MKQMITLFSDVVGGYKPDCVSVVLVKRSLYVMSSVASI